MALLTQSDMSGVIDGDDQRRLSRSGLVSFAGSIISAAMGFVLTLVLAQTLGAVGSGIVFQVIGVFTIALSISRMGMDSAAIWILPRLKSSAPQTIRGAAIFQLLISGTAGLLCALGMVIAAWALHDATDVNTRTVAGILSTIGWFLPIASMMLVCLSITRGLGGIGTYIAVGSISLPTARPLAVACAAMLGGSLTAVSLAWVIPMLPALITALIVTWVQIFRIEPALLRPRSWSVSRQLRSAIVGYAAPRTVSAILEQSQIWLGVLIVGALAGSGAAGIYGGVSRFVAAGLIIDSALRVVVSPRFSELIHLERLGDLESLYRLAARWLVLFSTPIYVMLAVFSAVVLRWLGPGFDSGQLALVILSGGAIVTFLAGNIHSVLLMSGRSGWAAINKAAVVALNVTGTVILVPVMGIEGAALAWAVSMIVDAALASIEVRLFVGIRAVPAKVLYALIVAALSFGIPAVVARVLWGSTITALAIASVAGLTCFVIWCRADSDRLGLNRTSSSRTSA